MKRRVALAALSLVPLALAARAQSTPPYRVAWVTTERRNAPSKNFDAFRGGLRELGYVEGRDIVIDVWSGDGSADRLEQIAPDIQRSRPDLVVAAGGGAVYALKQAGSKAPTVFSISADPVEWKIVDSFAHPGGNLTGISLFTLALVGKRLELIKEMLPGAKRIALVVNPQHPGEKLELAAAKDAAARLGLTVRYFPVTSEAELDRALTDVARGRDDAILAFADGFTQQFAGRFAAFSQQQRIPAIDGWAPFAEAGNLMTYGPVIDDVYRRLAQYVDKVRKGAKPADLPIELPTKVELVINLAVAKQLGVTVPPSLLARADEVIR
jgi:putative ABC transport system substrate-binding protein